MNPIHVANFTDRDLTKAMASSQTDNINDLAHYRANIIKEMREGHQLAGIALPWSKCAGDIALPLKYISILGGASGNKKSTIALQLLLWASKQFKVGFASFEMRMNYIPRMMAAVAAGVKEEGVSEKCVNEFLDYSENRIYAYDQIGDVSALRVLGAVEAFGQMGCKFVVVDSLMMVDLGDTSGSQQYQKERSFVSALSGLANIHDMHICLVTHTKKPEGNGGAEFVPNKNSIRGGGGITDIAAVVMLAHSDEKKAKLVQNKEKFGAVLSETEQAYIDRVPCQRLIIAKNRFNSYQGTISLFQHTRSRQLLGDRSDKAMLFGY